MSLLEIIIYSYYSPLQSLKGRDIFMTKPQFITDAVQNGILYYLLKWPIILSNAILKLDKLDKIIDSLAIIVKRNCDNGVFIIVF